MYRVENVRVDFKEGTLAVLRKKGIPTVVLDEIREVNIIKWIRVINATIQRDLL